MKRRAFTLTELLVVIAVVVALFAILIPAAIRARDMAKLVKCQNNLRQLGLANHMYLNDYEQQLPYSNWVHTGVLNNTGIGWLYDPSSMTGKNTDVKKGAFWPYLNTLDVYHCPAHSIEESGRVGTTDVYTSYLMNGAVNGFPPTAATILPLYRAYEFKADDVEIWEADERSGTTWNDGSSYPNESYNPAAVSPIAYGARHNKLASLLCFDGHVDIINVADFWTLASSGSKNRLWCKPNSARVVSRDTCSPSSQDKEPQWRKGAKADAKKKSKIA